jgi:hypothetical protein
MMPVTPAYPALSSCHEYRLGFSATGENETVSTLMVAKAYNVISLSSSKCCRLKAARTFGQLETTLEAQLFGNRPTTFSMGIRSAYPSAALPDPKNPGNRSNRNMPTWLNRKLFRLRFSRQIITAPFIDSCSVCHEMGAIAGTKVILLLSYRCQAAGAIYVVGIRD